MTVAHDKALGTGRTRTTEGRLGTVEGVHQLGRRSRPTRGDTDVALPVA